MRKQRRRAACAAFLAATLAALGLAGVAQAKLTGEYARFAQCPVANSEVVRCLYATIESGEVALGSKKVQIEKPVVLQGGYSEPNEVGEGYSEFFDALNGITLSKVPQKVSGGILGIVPPASAPAIVKTLIQSLLENSLTGVNATLERARPASEIVISENNLAGEGGVALKLPVKIHLENPFLGGSCFVGSSTSPIIWNLTTGTTSPPAPNKAITGTFGGAEFPDEGRILVTKGTMLVDNAWSAPAATGCGGALGFLINPIINSQLGATAAGHNTVILKSTVAAAAAIAVKRNDSENP